MFLISLFLCSRAFQLAFELLIDHNKDRNDSNCENMILFITDGKEGDDNLRCSPGLSTPSQHRELLNTKHCHWWIVKVTELIVLLKHSAQIVWDDFVSQTDCNYQF